MGREVCSLSKSSIYGHYFQKYGNDNLYEIVMSGDVSNNKFLKDKVKIYFDISSASLVDTVLLPHNIVMVDFLFGNRCEPYYELYKTNSEKEFPVYFAIYVSPHIEIRCYVPNKGNLYNKHKGVYNIHEDGFEDLEKCSKRNKFIFEYDENGNIDFETSFGSETNLKTIKEDIYNRLNWNSKP